MYHKYCTKNVEKKKNEFTMSKLSLLLLSKVIRLLHKRGLLNPFPFRRTQHILKQVLPVSREYVLLMRKSPIQVSFYITILQSIECAVTQLIYFISKSYSFDPVVT